MPMQAVSDLVVGPSGSLALETISSIVRDWRASLLSMIFIQLVDQTNVALAIVPTSSNDGDRFSLCCQTYERERERERASRAYTSVADERQTHSTLGETRCARSSNGASIQQQQQCWQCERRTTKRLVLVLQSMTHWPAGNLLFCERSRSYAS